MVTARDVARRAGVSDTVVSGVLGPSSGRAKCSAETRQRVLKAAEELGYRRHPLYSAMRTGRTHIMGLYLGDARALFTHPHQAHALATIEEALAARGYAALIVPLNRPHACDLRLLDGLIIIGHEEGDRDAIRRAAKAVPTFDWMGGTPTGDGILHADASRLEDVTQSNHECAARYLLDLGHRRIGLVEPWGAQRNGKSMAVAIFHRVADERGLHVELSSVFDYLAPRLYPNTMRFLDQSPLPTAIYALDDEVAYRIIDKLNWKGVSVPRDVSVFSRQTDQAEREGVMGLTGILTDWPACWRDLVNQYLDVIEGKRMGERIEAVVPAQRIVERTTCAAPAQQPEGR